jgi:hypothetical protein
VARRQVVGSCSKRVTVGSSSTADYSKVTARCAGETGSLRRSSPRRWQATGRPGRRPVVLAGHFSGAHLAAVRALAPRNPSPASRYPAAKIAGYACTEHDSDGDRAARRNSRCHGGHVAGCRLRLRTAPTLSRLWCCTGFPTGGLTRQARRARRKGPAPLRWRHEMHGVRRSSLCAFRGGPPSRPSQLTRCR